MCVLHTDNSQLKLNKILIIPSFEPFLHVVLTRVSGGWIEKEKENDYSDSIMSLMWMCNTVRDGIHTF